MLIFNEQLKKHNDAQTKFAPQAKTSSGQSASKSDRPWLQYSYASARSLTPKISSNHHHNHQQILPPTSKVSYTSSVRSQVTSTFNKHGSDATVKVASLTQGASVPSDRQTSTDFDKHSPRTTEEPPATAPVLIADMPDPSITPPIQGSGKIAVFKDSAPNVSQTPEAVMGNSNSLGSGRIRSGGKVARKSMAKTIAEMTPNGFKTLGPGFNRDAPAEKSFNRNLAHGSSLSSSLVPSDYEHIFHAPSQIADLPVPGTNRSGREARVAARKHRSSSSTKRPK